MSRTPPALRPYLSLPPDDATLTLLTGTLSCSATWLVARFVAAVLRDERADADAEASIETQDGREGNGQPPGVTSVLLVSWLRDAAFWKSEIARTTRLDTTKLPPRGTFHFIPALHYPSPSLADLMQQISYVATKISPDKIVVILDAPETALYLPTSTISPPPIVNELNTFILTIRSLSAVHTTIVSITADQPFLSAANDTDYHTASPTPLGTATAAFVVTQAHAARLMMSVRELETGAAKDISGVLRVTRGGQGGVSRVKETEALYLVQPDGGVKVFQRGAAE